MPNMYKNYGRSDYQTIHQERLAAIHNLKAEIEKAIPDEQDAQIMYEKMTILARNAGLNDKEIIIDLIRRQESDHETIFRDMLRYINAITQ